MQEKLKTEGYEVINYGKGGTAIGAAHSKAYTDSEPYRQSLTELPDVVIIGLGTNDSSPYNGLAGTHSDGFLTDADIAVLKQSALDLIRAYRNLASAPTVYWYLPLPRYTEDKREECYRQNLEKIREILKNIKTDGFVLITETETEMADASLYADKLHPNDAGYAKLADILYAALKR